MADIDVIGGVDEYWILGDLIAVGAQPIDVLERLSDLPNTRFVRGNTDRYIMTGERPPPYPEQVEKELARLPIFADVVSTMAWTQGAVASTGWMPFLDQLPLEQRLTLPNGTRLLGVHASPGCDGGPGIRPDYPLDEIEQRLTGCNADLVCVGHTHWPMNLHVGHVHVVNLGSVSNHLVPDLHVWYVLLTANAEGYHIQHRRVDYDRKAVIQKLEELRHPSRNYIIRFMRGERAHSRWQLPHYGEL